MTIEYQLERADFIAIGEEQRDSPRSRATLVLFWVLFPLVTIGFALLANASHEALFFAVSLVLSLWLIMICGRKAAERSFYSKKNMAFHTRPMKVSVAKDGVRFSSEVSESLYNWPVFQRVYRSSRFVVLEVTPLYKFCIPLRAFCNEGQIQEFLEMAQSCLGSGLPSQSIPNPQGSL